MNIQEIRIDYKGKPVDLLVRPYTQDEPMARGEVFQRDYYREYGKLEIKPGDTVIDLGANVGSFTILAGIEGASKIIAVEAHPETIELLEKNIETNNHYFKNPVTIFRGAVMAKSQEEVPFFLCNDPHGSGSHTATLNPLNNPDAFKKLKVKAFSLDDIIEQTGIDHVDFLKCDIEGAEYEVIENCSKLDIVRQISFEWHFGPKNFCRLLTRLLDSGFRVAWFEGDNLRGKLQVIRG